MAPLVNTMWPHISSSIVLSVFQSSSLLISNCYSTVFQSKCLTCPHNLLPATIGRVDLAPRDTLNQVQIFLLSKPGSLFCRHSTLAGSEAQATTLMGKLAPAHCPRRIKNSLWRSLILHPTRLVRKCRRKLIRFTIPLMPTRNFQTNEFSRQTFAALVQSSSHLRL